VVEASAAVGVAVLAAAVSPVISVEEVAGSAAVVLPATLAAGGSAGASVVEAVSAASTDGVKIRPLAPESHGRTRSLQFH
jgi:hypothetical protein